MLIAAKKKLTGLPWHRIKEFDTKEVEFREITLNKNTLKRVIFARRPVKCDFTKLDLFRVEFLDSVSQHVRIFFFFAAIDNENEKIGMSKLHTIPGRMLSIRRKNSNYKYQIDAITSSDLEKKLAQKSKFSKIFDLKIFEIFIENCMKTKKWDQKNQIFSI